MREEYGENEKLYVIRKNMGLSQGQFDVRITTSSLILILQSQIFFLQALTDEEHENFLELELWKKDNFKVSHGEF